MDKSEKCYYAVIKNKKRGKFYGASPSQVAKKVASNKLKSGKDMEFYLDEAGGKNKRYGPYQATKDKKGDKVVVVKGRKVMKGGLLSRSDKQILTTAFNDKQKNNVIGQNNYITNVDVDIRFYYKGLPFTKKSLLIFFEPDYDTLKYKYAIFVEPNGRYLWILQKNNDVEFINFCEFFLNPKREYLSSDERKIIVDKLLQILNYQIIIRPREGNIIKSFLQEIQSVISHPVSTTALKKYAIYFPDYSRLLIRKCVYPDLTFGILDEETPTRIPQNKNDFPKPESSYQKYLIYKNTGISGMSFNEPIIYVRDANIIQQQRGGTLSIEKIDNYLKQIDELISKIEIRNMINNNKDLRKYTKYNMKNINLTTISGIKKMNDDISQLETIIINLPKKTQFRVISNNEKKSQLERLNELKIILLQQKLKINFPQLQNQQFSIKLLQQQLQQQQLQQQNQLNQPEQVKVRRSIRANNNSLQESRRELQQQQLQQKLIHFPQLQNQTLSIEQLERHFLFDYCIFSSGSKLKIMFNGTATYVTDFEKTIFPTILTEIFKNLIDIPQQFGEFRRIKNVCTEILEERKEQQKRQRILEAQQERQRILEEQQKEISKLNNEYKTHIKNSKYKQNFNNEYSRQLKHEIKLKMEELSTLQNEQNRIRKQLQQQPNNVGLQDSFRNISSKISILTNPLQ